MCLQAHQCRVRCHTTTRNDWKVTVTKNFVSVNITHYCARHIHLVYSPRKRIFWPARKGNLTSVFFSLFQDAKRKVDIIKEIQSVVMNSEGWASFFFERLSQQTVTEAFLNSLSPYVSTFLKRIPLFSNLCCYISYGIGGDRFIYSHNSHVWLSREIKRFLFVSKPSTRTLWECSRYCAVDLLCAKI